MNDPTPNSSPGVMFRINDDRIVKIQMSGQFHPELSQVILRHIRKYVEDRGAPAGILLDVRHCTHLSIVRLSHLIDLLTEFKTPVAILFGAEAQKQLAILLHNTLNNPDLVAYFTEADDARAFLTGSGSRSLNAHL